VTAALIEALRGALGPAGVITGDDTAPYATDWRRLFAGTTPAVLRPASTAEVAAAVRLCAAHGVPIVPQGGNTSLVAGAVPTDGRAVVMNLARMDRVRAVDAVDATVVVEAGVTLARAQEAAEAAGRRLPLRIAAEGSAQIGGVLATNAGGNLTIRHGNARDLVLGLEVVLPDGSVFEGLRRLRKDNTGYALRQLFVGAEGTLGIITAAVLKLAPALRCSVTVLAACPSAEAVLDLLRRVTDAHGGAVEMFEFMSDAGVGLVLDLVPGVTLPLGERAPCYALIEIEGGAEAVEETVGAAIEAECVTDAVVAASEAQRAALWRLREEHTEAQARAGASVKNDVSVPVSRFPRFLAEATEAVLAAVPGCRPAPFGHAGDGNIHFNVLQPAGADGAAFLARAGDIADAVAGAVRRHDGSFSAEHGVGAIKTGYMAEWRGGAELELMRRIKDAIDPAGLLNPGKLLPPR
jgi:FAD/FMN-containing dehydrogenase